MAEHLLRIPHPAAGASPGSVQLNAADLPGRRGLQVAQPELDPLGRGPSHEELLTVGRNRRSAPTVLVGQLDPSFGAVLHPHDGVAGREAGVDRTVGSWIDAPPPDAQHRLGHIRQGGHVAPVTQDQPLAIRAHIHAGCLGRVENVDDLLGREPISVLGGERGGSSCPYSDRRQGANQRRAMENHGSTPAGTCAWRHDWAAIPSDDPQPEPGPRLEQCCGGKSARRPAGVRLAFPLGRLDERAGSSFG